MTYYIHSGATTRLSHDNDINITDKLEVGNYSLQVDNAGNFFLQKVDDFKPLGRTYGNLTDRRDRIINTFNDRERSTGVLLSGNKGSGKSLLSKAISLQGYKDGMSTIIVNNSFTGDKFFSFIQMISDNAIILFDEFEKVYDREGQESILTLLDGVMTSKKLFILTCNNTHRLDENLLNRTGRVYYHFRYTGLDENTIREYCDDNLKDQSRTSDILLVCKIIDEVNFDVLSAIVEEINRYGSDTIELVDVLNIEPSSGSSLDGKYDIEVYRDGKKINEHNNELLCDVLKYNCPIYIGNDNKYDFLELENDHTYTGDINSMTISKDDNGEICMRLTPDAITRMDTIKGEIDYEFGDEGKVILQLRLKKCKTDFNINKLIF